MATIALDARLTRHMSVGMKTYVRELAARLPKLAPDLEFVAICNDDALRASTNARTIRVSEADAANVSWGEQVRLPKLVPHAALIHYMTLYAPVRSAAPYVYTLHDLIHRRYPHYFSWKIGPYYRFVVGPVARRARAVITDAHATVADIERFLRVDAGRTKVVPLGVSEAFFTDGGKGASPTDVRARFGTSRPYFVYAGNHLPHKNLETLAAAWHLLDAPSDLVITDDGPLTFDIDRFAKSNGRILLTGHVSQSELIALYADSAGMVQPSLFEGFGLAVLEAMAAGAPVVVARTPVLLEVAGDAALNFAPTSAEELAAQLHSLLALPELADDLRARGHARALAYSWDSTARQTIAVYRECLSS